MKTEYLLIWSNGTQADIVSLEEVLVEGSPAEEEDLVFVGEVVAEIKSNKPHTPNIYLAQGDQKTYVCQFVGTVHTPNACKTREITFQQLAALLEELL